MSIPTPNTRATVSTASRSFPPRNWGAVPSRSSSPRGCTSVRSPNRYATPSGCPTRWLSLTPNNLFGQATMKHISVVTPCYNEEENVRPLYEAVRQVFTRLGTYTYEHIFIDNCSRDG